MVYETVGPHKGWAQFGLGHSALIGVTYSNRMTGQEGLGVDRFVDRRAR